MRSRSLFRANQSPDPAPLLGWWPSLSGHDLHRLRNGAEVVAGRAAEWGRLSMKGSWSAPVAIPMDACT